MRRQHQRHREAYEKAIKAKSVLKILAVKLNHIGLPRSGKTTFRLRLLGAILNILKEYGSGKCELPSTGVAEDGGQVIIKSKMSSDLATIQSKVWSEIKGLLQEAGMLDQFLYQAAQHDSSSNLAEGEVAGSVDPSVAPASSDPSAGRTSSTNEPPKNLKQRVLSMLKNIVGLNSPAEEEMQKPADSVESSEEDTDEIFSVIREAVETEDWDTVKYLLDDIILLINTDTGGQAEFLDLQASLVQGPSLNLLYSRLVDKLDSVFQVYYTNQEGMSTEKVESTLTLEEVLFQALASIAAFSGRFLTDDMPSADTSDSPTHTEGSVHTSESKVMFVGTHRDLVSEEEFKEKDRLLQQSIKNTEFYDRRIIEFASEDQLMLAVDNMSGGEDEIAKIRKVLEKVIEKCFKKIDIPAAWLVLSLYIRKLKLRTMTLEKCEELAGKLNISPGELQSALWFLHHRIGVFLYYPEVEALKDTVICDIQVVYDSTSNLIKSTFTFDRVGQMASEKFRLTGQFSLEDLTKATSNHTDGLIPLQKLVKLLEHRNILTPIPPSEDVCNQEPTYFMPCVLRSARAEDLRVHTSSDSDPAPLMLRYDCGYIPVGVFPAMITNIFSQRQEGWKMIEEGLYKNKVQFFVGDDYDTVTLIAHPRYFEVVISRRENVRISTKSLCAHVRSVIQSTLATVTSCLNYHFSMGYKFWFECPTHPGREHLCMLARETSSCMECLENPRRPQPVALEPRHQVWFPEGVVTSDNSASAAHAGMWDFVLCNVTELLCCFRL